jgi:hypothetical protein
MSRLNTYCFKAELSKIAIMDFISKTPAEYYFLIPDGVLVYGMMVTNEVMEFLINEFAVKSLEIISLSEIKKAIARPGAKFWGNTDLVNF